MINRGGPSLVVRIADQTGAAPAAIAAAFAAVRNSYDMPALNDEIDALDNKVAGEVQLELYAAVQDLLLDRLVWFLRNVDLSKGLADVVEHYRDGIAAVDAALDSALPKRPRRARGARMAELVRAGVPEALARRIADLPELAAAPDIVLVADRTEQADRRRRRDLLRRRGRSSGSTASRGAARGHRGVGLLRPAGARPRARHHRRRRAPAHRRDGRQTGQSGAERGRGLGRAARRRRSSASARRSTQIAGSG